MPDFSVDIDAPTPAQQAQPTEAQANFLNTVPDDYKEKDWVKGFATKENPTLEFFKEHDNQRSLIGKKAEGLRLPGQDAKAEDWAQFYKAIGVPEKGEDYKYTPPEAPKGLEDYFKPDEEFLKVMRDAAVKAGVRPEGFQILANAMDAFYADKLQKTLADVDNNLKGIEQEFAGKYGERTSVVLENFNKLSTMAPDWSKKVLDSLAPAAKAAVAGLMDEVSKRYIREDVLDAQNLTVNTGVMSEAEYANEYSILFQQMRQHKPGSAEYMKAEAKMAKLKAAAKDVFAKK